jgi:hypothetical protein
LQALAFELGHAVGRAQGFAVLAEHPLASSWKLGTTWSG